jgi:hypothetical protein
MYIINISSNDLSCIIVIPPPYMMSIVGTEAYPNYQPAVECPTSWTNAITI